ncbi:myozenin-2 isoform X2 [Scleropages formosus]|nr:myozenin-3 isoform X2 [Scleropages formosus]
MPRDLQMEELNLQSNRGSRMFLERQRRVEKFTVENASQGSNFHQHLNQTQVQDSQGTLGGKENFRTEILIQQPGKQTLTLPRTQTGGRKGNPKVLAPGYSGPLKEIPHEKFNVTVIPKSYCSPWREALGNDEELLSTLDCHLPDPPQQLQPVNYRCFNRAPMPFGGPATTKVMVPTRRVELLETIPVPNLSWDRMTKRPNFNRAPRGWGISYSPESNDL